MKKRVSHRRFQKLKLSKTNLPHFFLRKKEATSNSKRNGIFSVKNTTRSHHPTVDNPWLTLSQLARIAKFHQKEKQPSSRAYTSFPVIKTSRTSHPAAENHSPCFWHTCQFCPKGNFQQQFLNLIR